MWKQEPGSKPGWSDLHRRLALFCLAFFLTVVLRGSKVRAGLSLSLGLPRME
jgi:uncharacterized iron-regulated membrane protein